MEPEVRLTPAALCIEIHSLREGKKQSWKCMTYLTDTLSRRSRSRWGCGDRSRLLCSQRVPVEEEPTGNADLRQAGKPTVQNITISNTGNTKTTHNAEDTARVSVSIEDSWWMINSPTNTALEQFSGESLGTDHQLCHKPLKYKINKYV